MKVLALTNSSTVFAHMQIAPAIEDDKQDVTKEIKIDKN